MWFWFSDSYNKVDMRYMVLQMALSFCVGKIVLYGLFASFRVHAMLHVSICVEFDVKFKDGTLDAGLR